MCLACTCVRYKALSSPLNGADAVSQLWWTRCWPSCITALDYLFRRPPQTCRPLSLAQRLVKTQQTPLGARVRPTRVLNWCNDGEREQFPFLPTSWWRCSEGPGGRQFIMCPSPLALSLGGTGRHMCAWITNPPTYPALPSPPLPPSLTDTEEREHGGLEYARALKCIFTLSIKDLKCLGVRGTRVDVKPQHSGRFRIQKKKKKNWIYI